MKEKHNYSTQELYKKTEKWNKIEKIFLGGIVASAISISGIFGYNIRGVIGVSSKTPEIIETYQNAKETLYDLKQEKKLREKSNFQYKNKEIINLYRIFEKEKSGLENAINSVEKDISKIKENREFKKYQVNEKEDSKLLEHLYMGLAGIILFGMCGVFTASLKKMNINIYSKKSSKKKKNNLKKQMIVF